MSGELSRCKEILIDTYKDVYNLEDMVLIRIPFDNGEQLDFRLVQQDKHIVAGRIKLPENVYLLHKRISNEDSTGT